MCDHTFCFFPMRDNNERQTGKICGAFSGVCTGFWTVGRWLARRLHQLKASTTMDLGISIIHISA